MITIEFSPADIEALEYERYHHPHPKVQKKYGPIPITLVLDNARYQKCALVLDHAASLKIE
ncbi:MAG: hypothetical protein HS114_17605 [Anaerolineales bacterium]|nr:hypothetical protein [Anaerolineales bacterium]